MMFKIAPEGPGMLLTEGLEIFDGHKLVCYRRLWDKCLWSGAEKEG